MIVEWLVYAVVVSSLVSVAAWLAERGARAQGWPTRWVWAAAVGLSAALPVLAWLLPAEAAPSVAGLAAVPGVQALGSLGVAVSSSGPVEPSGPGPDAVVLAGWLGATGALLAGILGLAVRLWVRRRGWREEEVDGVAVLVSRALGPAAVGLVRGRVVVPEWALRLEAGKRRLLVLHEAEHVRAADPQLTLTALLVCAAAPWNLPLWWQLRRLRLAVEVDCDARVLRRTGDARQYGSLLLEVGRHRARLALALAEPKSTLERRIGMIMSETKRRATVRAAAFAAISAATLAVACETPAPTGPNAVERQPVEVADVAAGAEDFGCEPLVYLNGTPSTRAALEAMSPVEVDRVHVFKGEAAKAADADACGVIVVITKDASAEEREAGLRMVERLTRAAGEARGEEPHDERSVDALREAPTFTPMTVRPALKNREEVGTALDQYYPPLLRDAGIGGTASVWFFIDREGVVRETRLHRSSGHDALDEAALAVAEVMEFTPAFNREKRVPAWVALDIAFEAEGGAERVREELKDRHGEEESSEGTPDPLEEGADRVEGEADRLGKRAGPTFTPMTQAPRLANTQATEERLQSLYPPPLRDAGIGGTANVWLLIDETGEVVKVQLNESSGRTALDEAALAVAREMEFEPALNGEERVMVWVALDIAFTMD